MIVSTEGLVPCAKKEERPYAYVAEGMKFVALASGRGISPGDVITLTKDDGSPLPYFSSPNTTRSCMWFHELALYDESKIAALLRSSPQAFNIPC